MLGNASRILRSTPSVVSPIQPRAQPESRSLSCHENLSSIFKWNPSNSVGQKRKGTRGPGSQKKRKSLPIWTHSFVCLCSTQANTPPDSQERARLQIAGLGEKKISLNIYADAHDVYDELMFQFPKLSDGGGFELLRINDRGGAKMLEVINAPDAGYNVLFLKAVVQQAKIYVRPLQKDLSCSPSKEEVYIMPSYIGNMCTV